MSSPPRRRSPRPSAAVQAGTMSVASPPPACGRPGTASGSEAPSALDGLALPEAAASAAPPPGPAAASPERAWARGSRWVSAREWVSASEAVSPVAGRLRTRSAARRGTPRSAGRCRPVSPPPRRRRAASWVDEPAPRAGVDDRSTHSEGEVWGARCAVHEVRPVLVLHASPQNRFSLECPGALAVALCRSGSRTSPADALAPPDLPERLDSNNHLAGTCHVGLSAGAVVPTPCPSSLPRVIGRRRRCWDGGRRAPRPAAGEQRGRRRRLRTTRPHRPPWCSASRSMSTRQAPRAGAGSTASPCSPGASGTAARTPQAPGGGALCLLRAP